MRESPPPPAGSRLPSLAKCLSMLVNAHCALHSMYHVYMYYASRTKIRYTAMGFHLSVNACKCTAQCYDTMHYFLLQCIVSIHNIMLHCIFNSKLVSLLNAGHHHSLESHCTISYTSAMQCKMIVHYNIYNIYRNKIKLFLMISALNSN